ncbi:MAG: hypothetical protein MHM6MM_002261 [Cercozoa sp. M6MM]
MQNVARRSARASARAFGASTTGDVWMLPGARRIVMEQGLDPSSITGTGRRGLVLKSDVILALEAGSAKPMPAVSKQEESTKQFITPTTGLRGRRSNGGGFRDRKVSAEHVEAARRLVSLKQAMPHAYCTASVDVSSLPTDTDFASLVRRATAAAVLEFDALEGQKVLVRDDLTQVSALPSLGDADAAIVCVGGVRPHGERRTLSLQVISDARCLQEHESASFVQLLARHVEFANVAATATATGSM